MVKASLLLMLVLTVLVSMGLRWRTPRATAALPGKRRPGLLARGKAGLDRWVTAAAIAAVATIAILGGLHWLRILQQ
ncbi:hypothetical protein [Roseomonas sp. BN140053]|uniref:hypothetical protein n=1 Tax=Roseomonas sp. BN140053 TaxID=3391898 RepID=UPI0039E98367